MRAISHPSASVAHSIRMRDSTKWGLRFAVIVFVGTACGWKTPCTPRGPVGLVHGGHQLTNPGASRQLTALELRCTRTPSIIFFVGWLLIVFQRLHVVSCLMLSRSLLLVLQALGCAIVSRRLGPPSLRALRDPAVTKRVQDIIAVDFGKKTAKRRIGLCVTNQSWYPHSGQAGHL